jgi:hypothetical protein
VAGLEINAPHIRHVTKAYLPSTVAPLLCFRGSLFYVVERYQTTAIPDVDCHKDLHRSVQKVVLAKSSVSNCEQTASFCLALS